MRIPAFSLVVACCIPALAGHIEILSPRPGVAVADRVTVAWRHTPDKGEKAPKLFMATLWRTEDDFTVGHRLVRADRKDLDFDHLESLTDYRLEVASYDAKKGPLDKAVVSFKTDEHLPRIVTIAGAGVFRDLGGGRTADGKRIRQGLVFLRNDSPTTPEGLRDCRCQLGIKTDVVAGNPTVPAEFAATFRTFTGSKNFPVAVCGPHAEPFLANLAGLLNGESGICCFATNAGLKQVEIDAFRKTMTGKARKSSLTTNEVYSAFMHSTARERRNMMWTADVRKTMANLGTPPCEKGRGVPHWHAATLNMRDLGGWRAMDGKRIRYGRLFRSACFGKRVDTDELKRLGIKTDLDLRKPGGNKASDELDYVNLSAPAYSAVVKEDGRKWFRKAFAVLLDEKRYPIVFHCAKGADRTGTLAAIVELLLGVDENDVAKDWELTGFFNANLLFEDVRYDSLMEALSRYPGSSWMEKAEAFARDCGIEDEEISRFRIQMLEAPVITFGLVSDTHITGETSRSRGKGRSNVGCERAFRWFADQGVDAIVSAGDVTEGGNLEEVGLYEGILGRAFPNRLNRDGKTPVAHFSVWGNHDVLDASYMRKMDLTSERSTSIPGNPDISKTRVDGVPFSGETFLREIHGVVFAGVNWKHEDLGPEIIEKAAALAEGRPFFYVQHMPKANAALKESLRKHRNCIMLAGHNHMPVNDPQALVAKDGRVSVLCGSTSLLGRSATCGKGRFGAHEIHCSIVRVWSDRLTFERRELFYGEPLGDEVEVLIPGD